MKRKISIGKKLKAWRLKNKISLYMIAKSEGNGLRPERLKIIEEEDGGTSWALLCYLHFAYTHGYKILDKIWEDEVIQKSVLEESETIVQKSVLNSSEEVIQKNVLVEENNNPEKEVTQPSSEPPRDDDNSTSTEGGDTLDPPTEAELAEMRYDEILDRHQKGEPLTQDEQIIFIKRVPEEEQLQKIKAQICPICGKPLRQRSGPTGTFIGCSGWSRNFDGCIYSAGGTFDNPRVNKKFLPDISE